MKATVTQLNASRLELDWADLRSHIAESGSQLVLLPEMCFAPWFCAAKAYDEPTWKAAVAAHENWLGRLHELGADIVVGAAPRDINGKRQNWAYCWTRHGINWIHGKTYLPNDEGYWEASWFDRAPIDFQPHRIGDLTIGVTICTEIWFMQRSRDYGKAGVQLLLNPRSTPLHTNDKWLAGGRTAAVVAGAFCLSSNHAGNVGDLRLGGMGWICEPDGAALATTSDDAPFVTLDLDMQAADYAKSTYPRYVDDS